MAVRKLKPTSAGRRFQTVSDFEEIIQHEVDHCNGISFILKLVIIVLLMMIL